MKHSSTYYLQISAIHSKKRQMIDLQKAVEDIRHEEAILKNLNKAVVSPRPELILNILKEAGI